MVLCLVDDDPVSLEALTFARRFGEVDALVFGDVDVGGYVSRARRIVHERLDEYAPLAWAQAIVELEPELVVAPGTDRGHEVLAHVAARLGAALAANVVEAAIEGDVLNLTRQRWGGSLLEEARLRGSPKLLSVAPHVVEAEPAGLETTVEDFTPALGDEHFRVRVARREEPEAGTVRLDTARVVVGGGRGVGSKEGFDVLEELANLLGGAVGGSRVVTNLGWRPHSDQVGQTGARIAPDLYIACGVSGAIQHIVGCKGAKRILVINKDRNAPIVARADWAVIGDLHEIVPAIVAELRSNGS
ncbi:MAG: electron transfer flavoprotein subunit alpha/FixB family protein [Actinobacteria bacterium]|nr:MAG: electron transfer flavoprotein subunit alpha/FixB family protein [Actinomycetota bacterium]